MMLDRYIVRRLLWSLGIASVIVAVCVVFALASGATLQNLASSWSGALVVFALTILIVEFSGKLRSPKERHDRTLEDDWDR